MRERPTTPAAVLLALVLAIFAVASARAQDGVPIVFLPPPMEGGTISLGIFNGTGKLVRTLHREALPEDFKQGENGLITRWDGRDDAGQPLPLGKYGVHGWMTGDLGVEGVAFHGNDWLKDDVPRFTRVLSVKGVGRDDVQVAMRRPDGSEEMLGWSLARKGEEPPPAVNATGTIADGKLVITHDGESAPVPFVEGESPVACVTGIRGRIWVIVQTPAGREVRAYSPDGEFLRRLSYEPGEPQPVQIVASHWSEMIFLLDESPVEQRLRALALGTTDQQAAASAQAPVKSSWRVTYLKRIVKCATFDDIAPHLGRTPPPKAETEVKIAVRANPLLGDAKAEAALKITTDAEGVILKTADDLQLVRLTKKPGIKWAVLTREGKSLTLFQGDGTLASEFKIAHLENLMAFDAGTVELRAPGKNSRKPDLAPKRTKPMRIGDNL